MKIKHVQCCVSGGGPSGIMVAYLLARAGIEVVVLEKYPDFFRDFRGDTIHPSTMQIMDELGILDQFLKLPFNKTEKIIMKFGDEPMAIANFSKLNSKTPFIAFTPQWHFLNFLSEQAEKFPNFHLMQATEVTDILKKNNEVVGIKAINKNGEFSLTADLVIAADGRNSTVREKANFITKDLGAPMDVLWFKLPKIEKQNKKPFATINFGKMFIMIDRGDYWQCALIIVKGEYEKLKLKGLTFFYQEIEKLVPEIKSEIKNIKDWDSIKLLSVSVNRLVGNWFKKGVLCIGDAAHAMSPIGGVGVNLAIQDAVAAANVLIPAFKKGKPTTETLKRLQKRRLLPVKLTQKFQLIIQNKGIGKYIKSKHKKTKAPWFLHVFQYFPFLQKLPAKFIGLGIRQEHIKY